MSANTRPTELDLKLAEIYRSLKPLEDLQKLLSETHITCTTRIETYKEKQEDLESQIHSLTRERTEAIEASCRVKGHLAFFETLEEIVWRTKSSELIEIFRNIRERMQTEPNMTLEQLRQSSNLLSV